MPRPPPAPPPCGGEAWPALHRHRLQPEAGCSKHRPAGRVRGGSKLANLAARRRRGLRVALSQGAQIARPAGGDARRHGFHVRPRCSKSHAHTHAWLTVWLFLQLPALLEFGNVRSKDPKNKLDLSSVSTAPHCNQPVASARFHFPALLLPSGANVRKISQEIFEDAGQRRVSAS